MDITWVAISAMMEIWTTTMGVHLPVRWRLAIDATTGAVSNRQPACMKEFPSLYNSRESREWES